MKNPINRLTEQFKLVDASRYQFRGEFCKKINQLVQQKFQLSVTVEVSNYVMIMADEAISFTEAVIDKDRNYPEYRMIDELKRMDDLLNIVRCRKLPEELTQCVRFNLNELILNHYPALYDLSAWGYRLLERNVNFYALSLVAALNDEANRQIGQAIDRYHS